MKLGQAPYRLNSLFLQKTRTWCRKDHVTILLASYKWKVSKSITKIVLEVLAFYRTLSSALERFHISTRAFRMPILRCKVILKFHVDLKASCGALWGLGKIKSLFRLLAPVFYVFQFLPVLAVADFVVTIIIFYNTGLVWKQHGYILSKYFGNWIISEEELMVKCLFWNTLAGFI